MDTIKEKQKNKTDISPSLKSALEKQMPYLWKPSRRSFEINNRFQFDL